jgi:transcriptional regulator of acetoin/glycerol metabolism
MGIRPTKESRTLAPRVPDDQRSHERGRILAALKRNDWHRSKTARDLNMERTTLWRKMKRLNLRP